MKRTDPPGWCRCIDTPGLGKIDPPGWNLILIDPPGCGDFTDPDLWG